MERECDADRIADAARSVPSRSPLNIQRSTFNINVICLGSSSESKSTFIGDFLYEQLFQFCTGAVKDVAIHWATDAG